jgi:hypothetical protein
MQRVQLVTQQLVATWCCVEIKESHSRRTWWQAQEHENNDQK